MQLVNYHTHTLFSDGNAAPEKYIEAAIKGGLEAIGFSDHAPIPGHPSNWNMPLIKLDEYFDNILALKHKYAYHIDVLLSLEIDYIPEIIDPHSEFLRPYLLDYTIGSVHYLGQLDSGELFGFEVSKEKLKTGLEQVFDNNVRTMIEMYYRHIREMVELYTPTIIGHLDRIKVVNKHLNLFSEKEDWYISEVEKTLDVIAKTEAIVEINTKGMYTLGDVEAYPSNWILSLARQRNIPVHFAADAHRPDKLTGGFEKAGKLMKNAGYTKVTQVLENEKA